jgi:hypothetical protein
MLHLPRGNVKKKQGKPDVCLGTNFVKTRPSDPGEALRFTRPHFQRAVRAFPHVVGFLWKVCGDNGIFTRKWGLRFLGVGETVPRNMTITTSTNCHNSRKWTLYVDVYCISNDSSLSWEEGNSMRRLLYLVVVISGIVAMSPHHVRASSDLAAIVDAIRERTAAIESFDFQWRETRQIPKGAMRRPIFGTVPQPPLDAVIPPEDVQLTSNYSLTVKGGRLRHSRSIELWCNNLNAMRREECIQVFNGTEARSLFPVNVGDFPIGTISPSSKEGHSREMANQPLCLAFRMLDEHLGFPTLVDGVIDGVAMDDSGQLCDLVESEPWRDMRIVVWFSRERGYVPTRMQAFVRERLTDDLQIQYKSHDIGGWIPTAWQRVSMGDTGKVVGTIDATVTSVSINQRVSDGQFDLRFPPGTWVYDHVGSQEYVIRGDGSRHDVAPGEGRDAHDRLAYGGHGWLARVMAMLVFGVILAGAVFVVSRFLRRSNE